MMYHTLATLQLVFSLRKKSLHVSKVNGYPSGIVNAKSHGVSASKDLMKRSRLFCQSSDIINTRICNLRMIFQY